MVKDLKYGIMKHPNVSLTEDGGAEPYIHGIADEAVADIIIEDWWVLVMTVMTVNCFASNDPLTVVNNLSNFIFSLIKAICLILLGFGILQVGLSVKSHDPSQRANGFLTLAGGIIITFTKEILTMITG